MQNRVELLSTGIIYVEKIGDQTEQSMFEMLGKINQFIAQLRAAKKPVLILSNAKAEGKMDMSAIALATKIGTDMDYDKSATYGSSAFLHALREHLISEAQLNQKVANFKTKKEALAWLTK